MLVTVLGKRWNLVFQDKLPEARCRGLCDPPTKKNKTIYVKQKLQGEERLEVLIHEVLHAAGWPLDEDFVAQFSVDVARIIYKCGYTEGPHAV